ncbi:MAG: hypothetical protein RSE41_06355 [Clostridia bacterium]
MGLATVHSDSVYNTIDRLTTLVKRDHNAQSYKESYISKILACSINYIIYMKDYKIYEIAEVIYNRELEKIELEKI